MMCPPVACVLFSLALLPVWAAAQAPAPTIDDIGEPPTSRVDREPPPPSGAVEATLSEQGEKAHRAKVRSLMRAAVRESFAYDPSAHTENTAAPSNGEPAAQAATDPDIVVLDTYEVRTRAFDRDLPEAIKRWRPSGPQNNTKFGTGVRQKDFGKVRASVITILYVPVMIGFSW